MSGIGQRTVPTFDKNIPTNYVAGKFIINIDMQK